MFSVQHSTKLGVGYLVFLTSVHRGTREGEVTGQTKSGVTVHPTVKIPWAEEIKKV